MNWLMKRRARLGGDRGFTLIELLIVVAIIGILAAIAIPLYANVQQRARIAKAQADVRSLATAVSMYSAHTGLLPAGLNDLLSAVSNSQGQNAGPFMANVPSPPGGGSPVWQSAYDYAPDATAGTFVIQAAGDGVTARAP